MALSITPKPQGTLGISRYLLVVLNGDEEINCWTSYNAQVKPSTENNFLAAMSKVRLQMTTGLRWRNCDIE
jgi:hypothetical protein